MPPLTDSITASNTAVHFYNSPPDNTENVTDGGNNKIQTLSESEAFESLNFTPTHTTAPSPNTSNADAHRKTSDWSFNASSLPNTQMLAFSDTRTIVAVVIALIMFGGIVSLFLFFGFRGKNKVNINHRTRRNTQNIVQIHTRSTPLETMVIPSIRHSSNMSLQEVPPSYSPSNLPNYSDPYIRPPVATNAHEQSGGPATPLHSPASGPELRAR